MTSDKCFVYDDELGTKSIGINGTGLPPTVIRHFFTDFCKN